MSNYPPKAQNGEYIRPSQRRKSSVGRGGLSLSPEEKNLVSSNDALGNNFYYSFYHYHYHHYL